MNQELLQKMLEERFVSVQKHPTADLFIYNYTQRAQFGKEWNEVTRMCRGLILDGVGNIVARPFPKFFNLEEFQPEEIPVLPFEVTEKMDGSLGILYWIDYTPFIATRGSFTSEQAQHATHLLHARYRDSWIFFEREKTYLFEIIYPENRIVIDYAGMDDLVLLAEIDTKTGRDLPVQDIGFPIVKKYDGVNDITKLREREEENKEGFVVLFSNGFRVKMKFAEYVRLHRIVTGVSNIAIWEYLSEGKSLDELLDRVPDEFYAWVKHTVNDLTAQFNQIFLEAKSTYKEFPTRKESALYFQTQKYPHVMYALMDNKPPDKVIWKMIRPTFAKPYKVEVQ